MFAVQRLQRLLLEVGVQLDLVDRRHHRGFRQQPLQHLGHEVAHADGAHAAVGQQLFQRLVRAEGAIELAGQRLVQDQQVDVIHAQLAGTLVEGVQGGIKTVVADPHLGFDEDPATVQT